MPLKLGITSSSVTGPCFSMKTVFRTNKYKDSQYQSVPKTIELTGHNINGSWDRIFMMGFHIYLPGRPIVHSRIRIGTEA